MLKNLAAETVSSDYAYGDIEATEKMWGFIFNKDIECSCQQKWQFNMLKW